MFTPDRQAPEAGVGVAPADEEELEVDEVELLEAVVPSVRVMPA